MAGGGGLLHKSVDTLGSEGESQGTWWFRSSCEPPTRWDKVQEVPRPGFPLTPDHPYRLMQSMHTRPHHYHHHHTFNTHMPLLGFLEISQRIDHEANKLRVPQFQDHLQSLLSNFICKILYIHIIFLQSCKIQAPQNFWSSSSKISNQTSIC